MALLKPSAPPLVGVIASPAALARAVCSRRPPDLFELRLDALRDSLGQLERAMPKLPAPFILTARHPREGGLGQLRSGQRDALLRRFLEHATLVDLELRSVRQMKVLMDEIRRRQIGLIISHHDLRDTPTVDELRRLTNSAAAHEPAITKIASRIDTPDQLERLVSFFVETNRPDFPIAAMGIGSLGFESRCQLDRLGSALTYVSLGEANVPGQPTLGQLRRARRAISNSSTRRS
jgi:3-dehydroquinate dehydratase type I